MFSYSIIQQNLSHILSLFFRFSVCNLVLLYYFYFLSVVRLSPLCTAATTGLLYQPQMIDDGDCGEIGGMKIGRGNRSTRRKPSPVPLCPQQIPHELTRARTRAAAMGSRRLTAWAIARPLCHLSNAAAKEICKESRKFTKFLYTFFLFRNPLLCVGDVSNIWGQSFIAGQYGSEGLGGQTDSPNIKGRGRSLVCSGTVSQIESEQKTADAQSNLNYVNYPQITFCCSCS
jgi:hypothetical protein